MHFFSFFFHPLFLSLSLLHLLAATAGRQQSPRFPLRRNIQCRARSPTEPCLQSPLSETSCYEHHQYRAQTTMARMTFSSLTPKVAWPLPWSGQCMALFSLLQHWSIKGRSISSPNIITVFICSSEISIYLFMANKCALAQE